MGRREGPDACDGLKEEVVSEMARSEPTFLYVSDVMKLFDCSRSKAYQIIAELNRELAKKGFLFIRGRISRRYFVERYGA